MLKKIIFVFALMLMYSFSAKAQTAPNTVETSDLDITAKILIKERRNLADSINAVIINQPEEELKEFVRNVEAYKRRTGQTNTDNVDVNDKAQMRKYIKNAINMPETAVSPEKLNIGAPDTNSEEPMKYRPKAADLLN